jgi:hypothetical protein
MLTTPVRASDAFAPIVSATVPLALPLWPDETAIHGTAVVAVQLHPAIVVTPTLRRPPAAPIESPDRLKSNRQGAPAWLIETEAPPATMDPDRGVGTAFAATVNGTAASPCPLRSPPKVTHDASAATDQVQSRAVEIAIEPVPPAAPNEEGVLVAATWHLLDVGATVEVEDDVQDASVSAQAATTPEAIEYRRRRTRSMPVDLMHASRQLEANG